VRCGTYETVLSPLLWGEEGKGEEEGMREWKGGEERDGSGRGREERGRKEKKGGKGSGREASPNNFSHSPVSVF